MQVKINYRFDANELQSPCEAIAEVDGRIIVGCAATFDGARQRLMAKLKLAAMAKQVPDPETVEI